jgi:hypothetical protein
MLAERWGGPRVNGPSMVLVLGFVVVEFIVVVVVVVVMVGVFEMVGWRSRGLYNKSQ